VVGTQSIEQVTSWLVPGRTLFLTIHVLGVACFAYIVAKRLVPLVRGERDLRFDRPLERLGRVLKYWLGQWKHPRYRFAGTIHILIFAGFIVLAMRAFTVLIVGVNEKLSCRVFPVEPVPSTTSSRTTQPPSFFSAW